MANIIKKTGLIKKNKKSSKSAQSRGLVKFQVSSRQRVKDHWMFISSDFVAMCIPGKTVFV